MRFSNFCVLCVLTVFSPVSAGSLHFGEAQPAVTTVAQAERVGIRAKQVSVPAAVLDAGRVRKQVSFRGNKSARFVEFENLALAPQQLYAKRLLNRDVAINDQGVVNYAALPDALAQTAVERVETKITARVPGNPAITGYGRGRNDVYGALHQKRAQDARTQARLQAKLDRFQAKASRIKEKIPAHHTILRNDLSSTEA